MILSVLVSVNEKLTTSPFRHLFTDSVSVDDRLKKFPTPELTHFKFILALHEPFNGLS
jgi:hypothetical protein